jgi:ATP-dependent helicase HrpB
LNAGFPIEEILPALCESLAVNPRLVLEAPPGAGKTTQVPLALLSADWCKGRVLMLEPRRIAARGAASFMARQCGEALGESVGYHIRFERKVSASTRIEVLTEGILTRRLQSDPMLDGVSAVIFDEFHERHLASDLGLALCREVQETLRPDLRLIVMSATLDGARLATWLDAPRLTAEGRSFPVEIQHFAARTQEPPASHLRRAVAEALARVEGDVLCFLPGKREIEQALRTVDGLGAPVEILHGELGMDAQARLLAPASGRRIILATNVAESSVTLPGVRAVVDTGLAREPRFDPGSGMSQLQTVAIAQSSAVQRAGRAGRLGPGLCLRLWPESQRLDPAARPELQQVDLASFVLELKAWGSAALALPDAPPPGALAQAEDLLRSLGALDADGRMTAHGRALLDLGVHPRLGNAMLRAPAEMKGLACDIAAVLEAPDPLRGESRYLDSIQPRLIALHRFRHGAAESTEVHRGGLARIEQAARDWRRRLGMANTVQTVAPADYDAGHLLALAYPDRVARRDDNNPRRYQLANGRGALLRNESDLVGTPWLAIADLRLDARDSLIRRAAPLDERLLGTLFPERLREETRQAFNPGTRAVETQALRFFDAIALANRTLPTPRDSNTAARLCSGIAALGLECLPWTETLREWQARVALLRRHCQELALPDVDDPALKETLAEWLEPRLLGMTRVAELDAACLGEALEAQLDHAQRRAVASLAPLDIEVPSGQRRRLSYTEGDAPILAVKLQEMFGLADTPTVAKGRVPVVLHLLSPRQVPIQVTRDLRSFWDRTYPEVRRELKGRYPRHPWPEDPWTAPATHRAKPRGT